MTAVDLFCGCGGISVGLQRAGFNVLAGVDIEPTYLQSYKVNFPHTLSLGTDLSIVSPTEVMSEIRIQRGQLGILAGGPPCQGFSKNVPRKNRYLEDPKNQLVAAFLRFAEATMPRFILMENVAEMKEGFDGAYTNLMLEALRSKHLGYAVTHHVLHAADYGVPQRRRRAFFLATRDNEKAILPSPTHSKFETGLTTVERKAYVNVWDAISDLPVLEDGEGISPCNYEIEQL